MKHERVSWRVGELASWRVGELAIARKGERVSLAGDPGAGPERGTTSHLNIALGKSREPAQKDAHKEQKQVQLDERGDSLQATGERGASENRSRPGTGKRIVDSSLSGS